MQYKNPAVTADIVVLSLQNKELKILLIERKNPPFQGEWALPGGFLEPTETLVSAAKRELQEETGIESAHLFPIGVFDTVNRDPRGRTITMAYWTMITIKRGQIKAGSDAKNTKWFGWNNLPTLAFDHADIIAKLREQLQQLYNTCLPIWSCASDMRVEQIRDALERVIIKKDGV